MARTKSTKRTKKTTASRSDLTVADLAAAVERLAPRHLAAEWDNVGLLAGRPAWPLRRALVALDLTDAVAREALSRQVDALVLYHPPIFKGIQRITPDAPVPTTLLPDLLAAPVALFSLHTALDAAPGGTNDVLLDCFDIAERWPLEAAGRDAAEYKLVTFVPPSEAPALRTALSQAGAGVIGHYRECSYELDGHGTFCGDESTNPTVGQRGRLERVSETRLEMVVPAARVPAVVRTLYAHHSYEEPAFDLYPLHTVTGAAQVGMGRVGRLTRPRRGDALLAQLAEHVDLATATVVGDLRRRFTRVVAAAGAFGVRAFRDPDALVVTGEFKHHDALDLLKRGITTIALGHYASEQPVLRRVQSALRTDLRGLNITIARSDRGPFTPVTTPRGTTR